MPFRIRKTQLPRVIDLGNADFDGRAEETVRDAKRFKGIKFVGIDKVPYTGRRLSNFEQRNGGFLEELGKEKDESISLIRSAMALGCVGPYYNSGDEEVLEYTRKVIGLAYKKLKKWGKLRVSLSGKKPMGFLLDALKKSDFDQSKITFRPLTEQELAKTNWLRDKSTGEKFLLIAEK